MQDCGLCCGDFDICWRCRAVNPATAALPPRDSDAACPEVSFRIYFAPGETRLNDDAQGVLSAAQAYVGSCDYAEKQVRIEH